MSDRNLRSVLIAQGVIRPATSRPVVASDAIKARRSEFLTATAKAMAILAKAMMRG